MYDLPDLVEILIPCGGGGTGDPLTKLEVCRMLGLIVGMASTVVLVAEPLPLASGVEL